MSGNWLVQSGVSMLLLIPAWLAVGFFSKNYQIRPEVFLIWYFLGIITMSVFFGGSSLREIAPSWKIVGAILLVGATIGATSNILLFKAIGSAPNPGLPVAISNVASVGVFIAAIALSRWLPNYFSSVRADIWTFLGVVLTVVGASIIAIRR